MAARKKRSNIAVSIFLLALAGIVLFEGRKLSFGTLRVPQTAFFPTNLATLLAIFSFILLGQAIRRREPERGPDRIAAQGWLRIGATLATLVGFALVLEPLGFLLSTFLLMILLLRAIEAQKWSTVIAVALVTSLVVYFLFARLLSIPLPIGVLGI